MGIFDKIILASDFDGTLAVGGRVTDENRAAIKYFMDNGGKFTLATGRSHEYIRDTGLEINAPLISVNGTVVYDTKGDKIIKSYTFPCDMVNVIDRIKAQVKLLRVSVYSVTEACFKEPEKEDYAGYDKPINKMVFVFETEEDALMIKKYLTDKYGDEYALERSWPTGLEMRIKKGGKGECLKFIKEYTGSLITVGAGDFENDETLLRCADISYAPQNAIPFIKDIATRVGVDFKEHLIEYIVKDLERMLRSGEIKTN